MDEEKAAKTLTAVLAKNFGIQVVQDQLYKDKIVKNAFCVVQFSEPFIMGYDQFYMKEPDSEGNKYRFGFANTDRTRKQYTNIHHSLQEAVDDEEKCKGANYFFVGELVQEKDRGAHLFVTPYSIIGKKETQNLRNLFYKNVPVDIVSAMDTLGITDYVDLYRLYHSNSMNNGKFLEGYYIYLKLENMLKKLDFERYDNYIQQSRIEMLTRMSIEELNKKLDKNVHPLTLYEPSSRGEERYAIKQGIERTKNETKTYAPFGKWLYLLPDFLNFVFTLPLEDQNVETNKNILKLLAGNVDYIGILSREYFDGKHFQEYFDCLDAEKQEKLVDSLKTLQERNPINDSFLWSKGFKDVGMDYLRLYREDAETFIDYFRSRNPEEKKVIMKDIMECEHVNEKAINWLNENEPDLIREVSFNG